MKKKENKWLETLTDQDTILVKKSYLLSLIPKIEDKTIQRVVLNILKEVELQEETKKQPEIEISISVLKMFVSDISSIPTYAYSPSASYYENVKPEDMTLNFEKESSVELVRHIKAFHPWLPVYLECGNSFFIVNPYNVEIVDGTGKTGQIIAKDKASLTVATCDGKALKMDNLKLYRFPWLTDFIIKQLCV